MNITISRIRKADELIFYVSDAHSIRLHKLINFLSFVGSCALIVVGQDSDTHWKVHFYPVEGAVIKVQVPSIEWCTSICVIEVIGQFNCGRTICVGRRQDVLVESSPLVVFAEENSPYISCQCAK